MPPSRQSVQPKTFFLNETHELSPEEKEGGGGFTDYVGISWAAKSARISQTMGKAVEAIQSSRDPLKDDRYFVLAQPVQSIERKSADKKKAPQGTLKEPADFGGKHGKVFDRLGLDLLYVTDDGNAVVHGDREKVAQLQSRAEALNTLGPREQSRWVAIDSFELIPLHLRVDAAWLKAMKPHESSDVVFELQPVLTRVEADRVLRAIADLLVQGEGEKLTGTGTDFSGRFWFRGRATQRSVRSIAKDFYSIEAIHSPLFSMAAGKVRASTHFRPTALPGPAIIDVNSLPCVAVVDLGIPDDHKHLAAYRRGRFIPQDVPAAPVGDHGAFVASRVVFGDCQSQDELNACVGKCSIYDVRVGDYPQGLQRNDLINDKVVMEAMRGVRGAAPDVRVFNLSFGDARPLADFPEVERREKRLMLQDLDNFMFANDALVIVAAGNSPKGVQPNAPYPNHYGDPRWALGPWACGFNSLVCGSHVGQLSTGGLGRVGWPSPFSRVGPGLCEAPVPSFGAPGGNTNDAWGWTSGMGVLGFSGTGLPEDRVGTSCAAPLLAREAALALHNLQKYCAPGTSPFAVAVRAFLALTAEHTTTDSQVRSLAERTLGHGRASADRIVSPISGSAVLLWQGYIESSRDIVRVQLPIPLDWLSQASTPILRLVVCHDSPVNEAAHSTWACRKVKPVIHLGPDADYVRAPSGGHGSYPLIVREYNLSRYASAGQKAAGGDLWLLELSYEEIFAYPPGMDFDPRQRVAFAAELIDRGEARLDPQSAMQALPIAPSMIRLSIQPTAVRNPVIIRTRA